MEEKERKQFDDEKVNNNQNLPENEQNHKPKNALKNDELPIDEIEQLLKHLKEQIDINGEHVRIIKIDRSKPSLKVRIINLIVTYFFDILLIFSLNGYLVFTDAGIFTLLIFSLVFTTVESLFKYLMMKYLFKWMIASLGTILIPLTIFSFIIAWFIIPGLIPTKTSNLIIFFIIFIIVRGLLKMFIMRRSNNFIEIKGGKR